MEGNALRCPSCHVETPSDAEFCPDCGARLLIVCAHCATANVTGHRFCKRCGQPLTAVTAPAHALRAATPETYTPLHLAEKILTSRAALEGERKLVTVLFVDVSGFTAMSERLDPEDVHGLMDHAFELMLAEIHRYEGTVNQFLGDGLMALFGAPIAHEDHPARALRAALGMQRVLGGYRDQLRTQRGIEFQVRLGLNTGAVVVGKIGDNLRMDYTAVGDTTNLAARLLALAEPGQILVSEEIARAAGAYFVLQPLGEVAVKGKALPVRAYRVEAARAVRSRIEAVLERGLTELIGREKELALVRDRFEEALDGRGQAVYVFGEPGIGKSRLLIEFRREVEAVGARWLTGRCISYGRAISYLPVLDVLRDLLDIKESDDAETMVAKIDAGVRGLGDDLGWAVPFVRFLLSLDPGDSDVAVMRPVLRQGRAVEAVRDIILREGERRPVVLAIEDLHWIDKHSEEIVQSLLDAIAGARVTVLLTFRPGYQPPFGEKTYYTRITLHGLGPSQIEAMVEHVLGVSNLPAEARQLITERAEGNPLFIEELSRALVEDGTLELANGGYRLARPFAEAAIPSTIQGVIMARIDRLPEASKAALQVASVIGREFSARLVERLAAMGDGAQQALGELRAVELIYQKSVSPEVAYMFKHALTHDVAYESLLRQRRRALHQRAGEAIEELYPDRLAEFCETLAWHYVRGESWPKAVSYLLRSADKARIQFAFADGARHCEEALEILDRHGGPAEVRHEALEKLGDLRSLLGLIEPANQAYDRALEAAPTPDARRRIANKRHRLGSVVRDGGTIVYYEHGEGRPALVFVHPLVYGIASFQPNIEPLCQDFSVISLDPRGTGRSSPLPGTYLIRDHVEDLRAVIDATVGGPVVLAGNSAGARVATVFTATYPHLVEKLILIGSQPAPWTAPDLPYQVDAEHLAFRTRLRDLVLAGDIATALELFFERAQAEPGTQKMKEGGRRAWGELPAETVRNFFTVPDPAYDLRPLLPGIRCPTLVLHGERDLVCPLEGARYIARQIPGARLYVFKGRSHSCWATATAEFVRVVQSFIRTGQVELTRPPDPEAGTMPE
jgi:class 3 adenylate cyclase/pimeloyl-ACP methyl ester carboxylesterase